MSRGWYLIGSVCEEEEEKKSVLLFFFSYTLVSPVLQEVVFREDSEKNGLGVAPRSCFGVQGGCFLSSLSEGSAPPPSPLPLSPQSLIPLIYGAQIRFPARKIMLRNNFQVCGSVWVNLHNKLRFANVWKRFVVCGEMKRVQTESRKRWRVTTVPHCSQTCTLHIYTDQPQRHNH